MAYWGSRAIAVSVRCCVPLFDGAGVAGFRSVSHFCPAHVAVGSECQFVVGRRFVLHFGFFVSGDGYASGFASTE